MGGLDSIGDPALSAAFPDNWGSRVAEQFEELGWTAGLLRTLGERIARFGDPEARSFGLSLVKHADTLGRLKEGALAYTQRIVEGNGAAGGSEELARAQVVDALQRCGSAMVAAATGYVASARKLSGLGGEVAAAMGEAMIISKLVEERGKQMGRLSEKLRAEGSGSPSSSFGPS